MKSAHILSVLTCVLFILSCQTKKLVKSSTDESPFVWENALVYFLLTDRFNNGDVQNDYVHSADNPPAPFRGYMGGDVPGITEKLKEGYFKNLGINAIWMTPLVEQIQGSVDEGTGNSFGFHGYWTRDWTSLNSTVGTAEDVKQMIAEAHKQGIKVLFDVVANHTGPVTELDPVWPDSWVKTTPKCDFQNFKGTVDCTLVENLPDIRTERLEEVKLPTLLQEKWKEEGRLEREVSELDEWFVRTGFPRTPVYYILKWLVDFIREYGVDGFRVDTVKHTEPYVWKALSIEAQRAYDLYRKSQGLPEEPFYIVGEVYNYYFSNGREFDYGDRKVDFFDYGFDALINFDFKTDANQNYESLFSKYDNLLHGPLTGKSVLNYISSHDDGSPFDPNREKPMDAGTKLLLCPGGVQVYYGDESMRSLTVAAEGDARLRSFMNWEALEKGKQEYEVLNHWQKLGRFRRDHPAVGAGRHHKITDTPYTFSREWSSGSYQDQVVVALDCKIGEKTVETGNVFDSGMRVVDYYSGRVGKVDQGKVKINSPYSIVLLANKN